jgi:tetratricopeptide (TPR) repeat protein
MPAPSVFISYSHKDELWKDRLVTHLGVLAEQDLLRTWNDRNLRAGELWLEGIQSEIDGARVAVLLISANSLTSKFILRKEVPRFLELRRQAGMTIFPVIVKDCAWQKVPWLAQFQIRPLDGKPLAMRSTRIDSELRAIAEEILGIIADESVVIAGSGSTSSSTSTSLPALHQIPTPPGDFTGRADDLSALKSALAGGGTGAIFGLQGMGGVGKTTLALKLAEELESLYPDAQLYLDLKGVDAHPLSATQAMAHLVRSFHPEVRLPESETELAGLYRSVLHGKRALLLMDNAREREQIVPLIPPAGSLLLVTSRFHFTLPGLIVRDLDELPDADACNLLLRIAPRIGSTADGIARLCGRLPLALRLAGSALAERMNLSPADYARRLKEGKERLDPVEASLNLSYELLSEEQRRLWRLLAVFPDTFDVPAAAAVWDLEIDPATDVLANLARSSLVEWEDKDRRYRLHDLARSLGGQRIEDPEKEVARKRNAEHYLGVLQVAKSLYKKGGESILQGLRLFDTEWGNSQEGQAWAAAYFSEDAEAARICAEYPAAGAFLLDLRQHPRDRIRWRELALAAARQRKDRNTEAIHLGNLGLALAALGERRRAIELYEQWLTITRELGNRRGEGQALGNLGNAYAALGELRRAVEFHEQALVIDREIGDRRGEEQDLGNLGSAYAGLGEPHRAIELYEQVLTIACETGDRQSEGEALRGLGLAYSALGETRRAIEFYEQQLAITHEIGDQLGEANGSWNLGLALEKEGDLVRAADLMQVRVDYLREIGHPDAEKHAADIAALRARIVEQNP